MLIILFQLGLNKQNVDVFTSVSTNDVDFVLRRFCFNILCITFGPAFAFSNFDVAGCLGFAFDVFSVTALSLLASQSLMVLNC